MLTVAFVAINADDTDGTDDNHIHIGTTDYLIINDANSRAYTDAQLSGERYIYLSSTSVKAGAFKNCTTIREVYCSNALTYIGDSAFEGCTGLTHLWAWGLQTTGKYAFAGSGLWEVLVDDSLRSLGDYAFKGCRNLLVFQIEDTSMTSIGKGVFQNAKIGILDLRKIISIDSTAFQNCDIRMQVVKTGQTAVIPGVARLYHDSAQELYSCVMCQGEMMLTIDKGTFVSVRPLSGGEDIASYRAIYSVFQPKEGVDYVLTQRNSQITFPEGLGIDTVVNLSKTDFPYTLPTISLGDLTFNGWHICGSSELYSKITVDDMATKFKGYATAVPDFGMADVTYDHSLLDGASDTTGLLTRLGFTYGDSYTQLPDVEGYTHIGWKVGETVYGPADRIDNYTNHTAYSLWQPTSFHDVTYKDMDGTVMQTAQVAYHSRYSPDMGIVPTEEHEQRFIGWSLDGFTVTSEIRVTEDITLTPVFEERPLHTVIVKDRETVLSESQVREGRTYTIDQADPFSTTQVFLGWSDGVSCHSGGDTITIDADTVLESSWRTRTTISITFMDGSRVIGEAVAPELLEFTIDIADPTSETMVFDGWSDGLGNKYDNGDTLVLGSSMVLNATWREPLDFTITIIDRGNTTEITVKELSIFTFDMEDPVPEVGKRFKAWYCDGVPISNGDSFTITGSVTIESAFEDLPIYSVTVTDLDTILFTDEFYEGDSYTFSAPEPDTPRGKRFMGWYSDGHQVPNGNVFTVTGNIAIQSSYEDLPLYTVTVTDLGSILFTDDFYEGESFTFSAPEPDTPRGKRFIGWTLDGTAVSNGQTFNITGDITIVSLFENLPNYTVEVSDLGNILSIDDLYEGETYTFSISEPEAPRGKTFKGWFSGDNEIMNGDIITVTDDIQIVSVYEDLPLYTVKVMDGDTELLSEDRYEGESFTFSAPEPDTPRGKRFVGWTLDGTAVSNGDSFTVTGNIEIQSSYENLPLYTVKVKDGDTELLSEDRYEGESFTFSAPEPDTPRGKRFVGWYSDGHQIPNGNVFIVTGNIDIQSSYEDLPLYTVTVKDGEETLFTSGFYEGETFLFDQAVPETPIGKEFAGWYDGEGLVTADTEITVTSDIEISAKWNELPKHTVTIRDGDRIVETQVYLGYSYNLELWEPDSVEGKIFLGWFIGDAEVSNGQEITVDSDVTVMAHWENLEVCTVIYGGLDLSVQVYDGDTVVITSESPVAPEGKKLSGWTFGDMIFSAGDSVTVNCDIEFQPVWRDLLTFTVKVFDGDSELVSLELTEDSEYVFDVVDPSPVEGKRFVGWLSGDAEVSPGDHIVMTSDVTITSVWEDLQLFTVKMMAGETVVSEEHVYDGETFHPAVSPTAPEGKFFDGWAVDGEKIGEDGIVITGDIVINALWRDPGSFTVTIIVGDEERTIDVIEGDTFEFDLEDPAPIDGKEFLGWFIGDHKVERGDRIPIDGNMTIEPKWRDLGQYTVTFHNGDTIVGTVGFYEGKNVTIPSYNLAKDGYEFKGWSFTEGSDVVIEGDVLTPDGDLALYAVWKSVPSTGPTPGGDGSGGSSGGSSSGSSGGGHKPTRPTKPTDKDDPTPTVPDEGKGDEDNQPTTPGTDDPDDDGTGVGDGDNTDTDNDTGDTDQNGSSGGSSISRSAVYAAAAVAAISASLLAVVIRRS